MEPPDERNAPLMRRWSDRPVPFLIELTLGEIAAPSRQTLTKTAIHVVVRPKRQRDRRRRDVNERAKALVASLKSYLMAQDRDVAGEAGEEGTEIFMRNTQKVLSKWLTDADD